MVECFLRQVLVVQPDVARERGFQIRATLEVVASQHLADATMEAFDHAVGLRATDGRQAVFDAHRSSPASAIRRCWHVTAASRPVKSMW